MVARPSLLLAFLVISTIGVATFSLFECFLLASVEPSRSRLTERFHDGIRRRPVEAGKQYPYWRQVAVNLAKLPAEQVLTELTTKDPFGARTFEKKLMEHESANGRVLTREEVSQLFSCPVDRITLPDYRNESQARTFRAKEPGYFLYLQHLRKAGGTHFCSLARENLHQNETAAYYCMSDYAWSHQHSEKKNCAGCLHQWTNEEIVDNMRKDGHRMTGNEWDNFDRLNHFELPAVFATSFRRPMDRALSQFRFECLENRGCTITDVGEWWRQNPTLYNVYTTTFADVVLPHGNVTLYQDNSTPIQEIRAQMLGNALDTVAKFHLVLSMEWLAYAETQVSSVLGFSNTSALTHRVRPHIQLAMRDDGQEVNEMGASGIAKASLIPEEYLTPEQYKNFSEHLALDAILTDAARRIFLERLVCDDVSS